MAFIDLRTQQDRRQALLEMGMKNLMTGIQGFEERSAKEDALLRDQEKQDRETAIAFAKEGLPVPPELLSKKKAKEPGFLERLFNPQPEQATQSQEVLNPYRALTERVRADKQLERGKKAKELEKLDIEIQKEKSGGAFSKEVDKKAAASFSKTLEKLPKIEQNISKVDDAIQSQIDYSKGTTFGTGPFATAFGSKRYVDQKLEGLNARYQDLSMDKLVTTFTGMSKAIDSDAERKAFEATTPKITNDDATNIQILLGMKSAQLKEKSIIEGRADWIKEKGNTEGFDSNNPVLQGQTTTVVNPQNGEMQLIFKNELPQAEANGLMSIDTYTKELLKARKNQQMPAQQQGLTPQEQARLQELRQKAGK